MAEGEIVAAAEALLRERPFRELTVDEVMRRTELSRPSFYVYFRDRHHLILRVVEHIGAELRTMSQRWYTGAGDGPALAREAMDGIVEVYGEHGPVLRGLADAAADDPEVERVYAALVQSFVDVTVRHIEAERETGRVLPARCAGGGHRARVDDGALPEPLAGAAAVLLPGDRGRHPGHDLDPRALWPRQCLKCRRCVNTMQIPAASAASTTSWSRIDPPGWMIAVTPASMPSCGPSGNGK